MGGRMPYLESVLERARTGRFTVEEITPAVQTEPYFMKIRLTHRDDEVKRDPEDFPLSRYEYGQWRIRK